MIKKIIVLILIITAVPLSSMELPSSAKKTPQELAQQLAGKITLISQTGKDGDTASFLISRAAAQQSQTIKNYLSDTKNNKIIFTNISSKTLEEMVILLEALYKYKTQGLKGKVLLDALDTQITVKNPLALLQAANYLDVPILIDFAAREVAQEEVASLKLKKIFTVPLVQRIKNAFGSSAGPLLNVIAHYYVLVSRGQKLKDVTENSYGFSFQDYLDYTPELIAKRMDNDNKSLDLSGLQLYNLDGLEELPKINTLLRLNLSNNQLTQLPEFIINLPDLGQLNIFKTKIATINPSLFKGKSDFLLIVDDNEFSGNTMQAIKKVEPSVIIRPR